VIATLIVSNQTVLDVNRLLILLFIFAVFNLTQVYAQTPKLATFQETAQILIDQKISNNVTAAIALQTTSNQEIRVPTELVKKIQETEKVLSVIVTSEEQCVLGVPPDESCIMINMSVQNITGGITAIQDTGRQIGDSLIGDINDAFDTSAEFHSVFIHQRDESGKALGTSGVISGEGTFSAVYTMPREDTQTFYEKFSAILLPPEIRESGGFYDLAKKLSEEKDARMTLSIIPQNGGTLFQLKISIDYPNSAQGIREINPLEFLKTDELKRSNYFSKDFYPLNSLLKIVVLSPESLKISSINTKIVPDVIRNGERFPEFTNDGWFFDQSSGEKIEATYLFGKKFSVTNNELVVKLSPADGSEEVKINTETDSFQIVILVGIVMAAAGAAIYYMKGFRAKTLNK
jgi:hypothetical protein